MALTSDDYLTQLHALLPPGAAWTRDPDATLTRLLHAYADELARIDARSDDLVRESDPRDTLELLVEWLSAFGLPDECTPADAFDTLAERRAALIERVTATGGATAQYLIGIAAAMGFAITIEEFRGTVFGFDDFGSEFVPPEATLTFEVHSAAVSVFDAEFGNTVFGEAFGDILENAALECLIDRARPAHTQPYYVYSV